ncbi:MAG: DUF3329 domain-containing protein [Inquilinus sp.]|nr:DUF3329 domain-containing protein [Inquilinus sp.]
MIKSGEPHPWLVPLYRRVAVTAVCAGWLAFETIQQEALWLLLASLSTGYALWNFFLSDTYRKPAKDD